MTNPGGPGSSGLGAVHWFNAQTDVMKTYDVIGMDPRGVGRSTQLRCITTTSDDEFPTDGAINDGYDPCCDIFDTLCAATYGHIRYAYNPPCVPQSVSYFCVEPGSEGIAAGRFNVAWLWLVDRVPGSCERCLIVLQVCDAFDSTCSGPPMSAFLAGAIFEVSSPTACDLDGDGTGESDGAGSDRVALKVALDSDAALTSVVTAVAERGSHLVGLAKSEPSLEDVFVELVGRGFGEDDGESKS